MSARAFAVRPWGMEAVLDHTSNPTNARRATAFTWVARVVTAFLVLVLLVDGAGEMLRLAPYVEGTARVGYPPVFLRRA